MSEDKRAAWKVVMEVDRSPGNRLIETSHEEWIFIGANLEEVAYQVEKEYARHVELLVTLRVLSVERLGKLY